MSPQVIDKVLIMNIKMFLIWNSVEGLVGPPINLVKVLLNLREMDENTVKKDMT